MLSARELLAGCRYLLLCLRNRRVVAAPFYLDAGAAVRIEPSAVLTMGSHVRMMRDFTAHITGRLVIGSDVFFNRGCHIVVLRQVSIGSHCLFGESVSIHDENHCLAIAGAPRSRLPLTAAPVRIGDNVWIGAKCTITAGVTIGDDSVIGANSVVTRDIPARCLAAGVPARVIRYLPLDGRPPCASCK
jgi:acetyltransferase-like isoleucine patch superfamily enzyme